MPKKTSASQVYKNWFLWILFLSAATYYFTREEKKTLYSPTAEDNLQSKLDQYMQQLDSGHISGNMLKNKLDENARGEIFERVPLNKLLPGSTLTFGQATPTTDEITLTILSTSSAEIQYIHRFAMNGDTNTIKESIETGIYQIQEYEGSQVLTDNDTFPSFDPSIVLTNMQYGADKGYKSLSKKFFVAKSKHIDGTMPSVIRIYPWLDPINYPSRRQEFSFATSHEISGLNSKK